MAHAAQPATAKDLLGDAMRACMGALVGVGLVSAVINVLYLTGSFYMLEVYDRVLPSQSIPTLVGLSILVIGLFAFQGFFDFVRSRILVRVGAALDEKVNGPIYDALVRLPLLVGPRAEQLQPLRNIDQVRAFVTSMGPPAFFDLPWMPFYLAICFAFHPLLGWTATVGALMLVVIAILTEVLARRQAMIVATLAGQRAVIAESGRRNAEVLGTMGMARRMQALWRDKNLAYLQSTQSIADVIGGLGALSKVLRMMIQSAVLGVGAYLVILQEASGGLIIAGSILAARALAPVELAVGNWKGFMASRQSWKKLKEAFALLPSAQEPIDLPAPKQTLAVEGVSLAPPGAERLVVADVSFTLKAGDGLGIIGPSASGKSTLARAIAGIWLPQRGKIRLDGAALEQWGPESLGSHIGYLPQSVELLAGTVSENISRFTPGPLSTAVVNAATAAGVHEMILRLPNGYETEVGEDGTSLSAGQRQRVALARALYGEPFVVILDEPNSNLDSEGDGALTNALLSIRRRGGIVIVIAHRPSALAAVDTVLMMQDGRAKEYGPREEVIKKYTRPPPSEPQPLRIVSEGPGKT